jgi:hypothetical protein
MKCYFAASTFSGIQKGNTFLTQRKMRKERTKNEKRGLTMFDDHWRKSNQDI